MEKKKLKQAAVLKYSPDDEIAPKIVALGKGEIAERILEIAKENSVPVYENPELAQTLNAMSIGEEIPPELYEIVAQILVFVSDLDNLHAGVK